MLLIGTNTAECHPVLFQRLLKRKRKQKQDLQIVVVDPRATATSDAADLHLAIRPGTDLALLHGLGHLLLEQGAVDRAYVAASTEGFEALAELWAGWTPEKVSLFCGIEEQQLRQLAARWAASTGVVSLWSMGVNQSVEGTATVAGIINLHLVSGQIGRPGAGPFSLTGQPNAMGGREAGGWPGCCRATAPSPTPATAPRSSGTGAWRRGASRRLRASPCGSRSRRWSGGPWGSGGWRPPIRW